MTSSPPIRIGLLWHSLNSDNLGVGALTESDIRIVSDQARRVGVPAEFLVLGFIEPGSQYVKGEIISVFGINTFRLLNLWSGLFRKIRDCDFIIDIGGGDSFTDIYGIKRFLFLWFSKILVLLSGRPLILAPQTIGPFQKGWTRALAKLPLKRAYHVFARDDLSFEAARGLLGCDTDRLTASTDVALRLPYEPPEKFTDRFPRVGINVSALLFHGGYSKTNQFDLEVDYPSFVRSLISLFSNKADVTVILVPHVISDLHTVEDDFAVCLELAKEFPDCVVAPKFNSPSEAKSFIAGLDFLVGARMHACIAALSSSVPVVPTAYSRKFRGLFAALGYDRVLDLRTTSENDGIEFVRRAFEQRRELQTQAAEAKSLGLQRLKTYEDVLAGTMGDLVAGRSNGNR